MWESGQSQTMPKPQEVYAHMSTSFSCSTTNYRPAFTEEAFSHRRAECCYLYYIGLPAALSQAVLGVNWKYKENVRFTQGTVAFLPALILAEDGDALSRVIHRHHFRRIA